MPRRFPLMPRDAQPPMSEAAMRWLGTWIAAAVLAIPLIAWGLRTLYTGIGVIPSRSFWRGPAYWTYLKGVPATIFGWGLLIGGAAMLCHVFGSMLQRFEPLARSLAVLGGCAAAITIGAGLLLDFVKV